MRQGISRTAVIYLVLGAAIILIFLIFIGQQKGKTEETIFVKIWNKFFPKTTETVVIKGTAVGAGCAILEINGPDLLAQALIDCWKQGKEFGDNVDCCYKISPKNVQTPFGKSDLDAALARKPEGSTATDYSWNIGGSGLKITKDATQFIVCYDYNLLDDEMYITYDPSNDCS